MVVQDYVVCYFDLLGQRSGLLKGVRETPDVKTVLSEIDKVSRAIQRFNAIITGTKKVLITESPNLLENLGLSDRYKVTFLERIKNAHFGIQQFSDATFFFANIENDDGIGLGVFIVWCLYFAANFLHLLSDHLMIRGGITVGKGWEIPPDYLYGPVLEDVYNLESKIAVFPRIVITDEALHRLEEIDQSRFRCMDFFTEDYDGVRILDYLSIPVIRWFEANMSVKRINIIHALKEAINFIRTEYYSLKRKVSQDISYAGETRKLAYLLGYWQSRLESIVNFYDSSGIDEKKS